MYAPGMVELFDSHVHLDGIEADDPADVIRRAGDHGVSRMVAVGCDPEANRYALMMAGLFPFAVLSAVGYDRDRAGLNDSMDELRAFFAGEQPGPVAIGETGLDYHYHPETAREQESLFEQQLELAGELSVPVIVHSREADDSTVRHLKKHARRWKGDPERVGVLHCFSGSPAFAESIVQLGLYVSFSGIVTFKNAGEVREAAALVPANRILLETDSPLLAPAPVRGRPNEPANLEYIARAVADTRDCSLEEIAETSTSNAVRLFVGE